MKNKKKGRATKRRERLRKIKGIKRSRPDGTLYNFYPRHHLCICCDNKRNKIPRFFLRAHLFNKRSPQDFLYWTMNYEQHRDYSPFFSDQDPEEEIDLIRRTRKPAGLNRWKKVLRNKERDDKVLQNSI